jgi:hypothetical protein
MSGDPGKGDAERSVLEAGRDKHSCQLVDRAVARASREMPPVDFALGKPLAGAIGTSRPISPAIAASSHSCAADRYFCANGALWISSHGLPMNRRTIHDRITIRTLEGLGRAINPHLFRDCAATSIAIDDPDHAKQRLVSRFLIK